jgi:hypothetical protein
VAQMVVHVGAPGVEHRNRCEGAHCNASMSPAVLKRG